MIEKKDAPEEELTEHDLEIEKEITSSYKKGILTGIMFTLIAAAGGFFGYYLAGMHDHPSVLSDRARMSKLETLEQVIDDMYLDEVDEDALAEGIYTGLVYGLGDPYSRYYTAEDYQNESQNNEGSYVGIGITMHKGKGNDALVTEVYDNTPAFLAGLQPGDEIRTADGQDVRPMTDQELISLIKSAEDSVTVTVYRPETDETLELDIQVRNVEIPTVSARMLDNAHIGYIKIYEFTGVTPDQFRESLQDLRDQGMERLIIDLRNNPGGLVSSVCDVLRQILPEGLIVYTEDKDGHREEEYCDGSQQIDIPLAVLTDGTSASAAEIFAGAVQDYDLGPIVGETTYGKGIVQSIRTLSDGSAVKLTTARYYTPDGHNIHGTGIEPDIIVPGYDPYDSALDADATEPNTDTTEPDADTTESDADTAGSDADTAESGVDTTESGVDTTETDKDTESSDEGTVTSDTDTTSPEKYDPQLEAAIRAICP